MSRYLRPTTEMSVSQIDTGMSRGRQMRSELLLDLIRRLWHPASR